MNIKIIIETINTKIMKKNDENSQKRGSWAIVHGGPKKGQKWAKIRGPRKVRKNVIFYEKMMKNGTDAKLLQKLKKSSKKLHFLR